MRLDEFQVGLVNNRKFLASINWAGYSISMIHNICSVVWLPNDNFPTCILFFFFFLATEIKVFPVNFRQFFKICHIGS